MRFFALNIGGSPRTDDNIGGETDSIGYGNDSMTYQENSIHTICRIHDDITIQYKHDYSLNGYAQIVACSNDIHETFKAIE